MAIRREAMYLGYEPIVMTGNFSKKECRKAGLALFVRCLISRALRSKNEVGITQDGVEVPGS